MRFLPASVALLGALCLVGACHNKTDSSSRGESPAGDQTQSTSTKSNTIPAATDVPTANKPIPAPDDVAKPPKDAKKTASGLVTQVLRKGSGTVHPAPWDKVRVNYTGWTTDGHMFDSSVARGRPATFGVGQVIKGWTEGLQLMVEGEKRRMWIPADLAYGAHPRPGAPKGELVFDVDLLDIIHMPKPPEPPKVPKDVKAPPVNAKKTKSGLAYRVLEKGKGKKHPTADSRVTVDYTGWTTDGKMFDSSVVRGQPATFSLGQVIKGWTEGVQLMVEGEKARFWIPADLAYGKHPRPGAPQGMLVFDIKLIKIQ